MLPELAEGYTLSFTVMAIPHIVVATKILACNELIKVRL